MRLSTLNLNQLVALDALIVERHVGRAAQRMGVTQSAMSHTLRGLRTLLDDPLLVRVGNEMLPTPFAQQAAPRLRAGLGELEAVVSGRAAFDPSETSDTFTVALQDGPAAGVAAALYRTLRERAPRAKLRIQDLEGDDPRDQLASGRAELAFVGPMMQLDGLELSPVEPVRFSVFCSLEHSVIRKRLSLSQFCKVPHAVLSIRGEGPSFVDKLLAERGLEREVEVRVPHLMALAEIVASSELLCSLPEPVAEFLCHLWPLKRFPFPIPLKAMPGFLAWHPRYAAEPAHRFFRTCVADAFRQLSDPAGPSMRSTAAMRKARVVA